MKFLKESRKRDIGHWYMKCQCGCGKRIKIRCDDFFLSIIHDQEETHYHYNFECPRCNINYEIIASHVPLDVKTDAINRHTFNVVFSRILWKCIKS